MTFIYKLLYYELIGKFVYERLRLGVSWTESLPPTVFLSFGRRSTERKKIRFNSKRINLPARFCPHWSYVIKCGQAWHAFYEFWTTRKRTIVRRDHLYNPYDYRTIISINTIDTPSLQ